MDHSRSNPDPSTGTASDSAETVLDAVADRATIKQHAVDPDAETHKLDPRFWAPLRVCPQCSLAWETDADWCASCGTAFDARDRETEISASAAEPTRVRPGRTGERSAARRPRARRAAPSTTRNTGERAAAHAPSTRNAAPQPRPSRKVRSGGWALAIVLLAIIPLAFVLGQSTRQSHAEVNAQIDQAVKTNTQSALASAQRSLQRQRNQLQREFNTRVTAAEQQAYAEGKANAIAQRPQGGLTADLKRCIANLFQC
jgi:hypothetical protein